MSVREHFTLWGQPKVGRSQEDAVRYAEECRCGLEAYLCSWCGWYHVGYSNGEDRWADDGGAGWNDD